MLSNKGLGVVALAIAAVAGTTQTASAQYCTASSGYTACNAAYEYISRVQFNTIDNSTVCDSPHVLGYEDFSGISTNVLPASTNTLTVTIGTPFQGDRLRAWIDWDHSQTFEDSELYILTNNLGGATQVMQDITAPANALPGPTRMRVRITWNQDPLACGASGNYGNIEDYTINVGAPTGPTNPSVIGSAAPTTIAITGQTLLRASVFGGFNPTSTGLSVHGDLSSINGSNNQLFYDDGTHGDLTAGDNVFSFLATAAEPLSTGTVAIPLTVTDAQSRSGTANINVTLTAAPTGPCCLGGNCSMMTSYSCTQGGGTYMGNGGDCAGTFSTTSFVSSTAFPVTIPQPTTSGFIPGIGTATITIPPGSGTIQNLAVRVGLTHTWIGDIKAEISNGSITIPLIDRCGVINYTTETGYQCNYAGVYTFGDGFFDDLWTATAPNATVTAYNVPSGNFHPSGQGSGNLPSPSLAAFNGMPFEGTWTLTVGDWWTVDAGTITSFELTTTLPVACGPECSSGDFDGDGDTATDADIEAFFACIAGNCCATCWHLGADFNGDGDTATDLDIESFFSVIAGGTCHY